MSWVDRERRTALLVRACYDRCVRKHRRLSHEVIYALCRLTWITKGGGEVADSTRAVVAPALSTLLRLNLTATTVKELASELRGAGVPTEIAEHASRPVGIVNYYGGFRGAVHAWIRDNLPAVRAIVVAITTGDDKAARGAYAAIDALPKLPRVGGGDGKPSNLLTPLLACLAPRGRAPIINGRKEALLRRLGLGSATLAGQYDGLVNLIGQAGIKDAFDLDVADEARLEAALKAAPRRPRRTRRPPITTPLRERRDEDVEYLRSVDVVTMQRLHNTMTTALLAICTRAGLPVEQGSDPACLFDALVRGYREGRGLLIEVKTSDAMSMCRMAVGQLLDYRRHLYQRAAVDLAVLFPNKPSREARAFLADVGVKVVWFDKPRSRLEGAVRI